MCVILSRGRTWGSHLSSAKPLWALTAEGSRTILGLQSHPHYYRDFDSISHCCADIRVWRQTCWSTKTADQCSDGSIPQTPFWVHSLWGFIWQALSCEGHVANWPRFIPNSMDSVPLEGPAAHFQFPGCLSELATCHCNLQREFSKGSCFLFLLGPNGFDNFLCKFPMINTSPLVALW